MKEVIGFIGAGNMATALISGLINSRHSSSQIIASSPEQGHLDNLTSKFGIKTSKDNNEVLEIADVLILAVKPNMIESVILEIKDRVIKKDVLVISIAAGIKIKKIESLFGSSIKVIRAMPNTPASIMEGVTAITSNQNVKGADIDNAKFLFECVGKVAEIKEEDIDIFTALIGSGPAYVFYLIESLLSASENLDLSKEKKVELLASMISGAANLVIVSEDSPKDLRKKVTSPGGVTQRAIEEFEILKLKEIIKQSMEAAENKSIELGDD